MSSIKDRNSMNLTEAEDIKKRWQKYMEELYKKHFDPNNTLNPGGTLALDEHPSNF